MPTSAHLAEQQAVADPTDAKVAALQRLEQANAHRSPTAKPTRRHRKGIGFVREADHCRPLDRNDRAKILFLAEQIERRSKAHGKKNGALGYIALRVLKALLCSFMNAKSGLTCPSYTALQCITGLSRQAISDALHRLEATKLVTITRRLVRERITRASAITGLIETFEQTVQGTNLYSFAVPDKGALIPLPYRSSRRRPHIVKPEFYDRDR